MRLEWLIGCVKGWEPRSCCCCSDGACHRLLHLRISTTRKLPLIATPNPAKVARRTDRTACTLTCKPKGIKCKLISVNSFMQRYCVQDIQLHENVKSFWWQKLSLRCKGEVLSRDTQPLPRSKIYERRKPPKQIGSMHKTRQIFLSLKTKIKHCVRKSNGVYKRISKNHFSILPKFTFLTDTGATSVYQSILLWFWRVYMITYANSCLCNQTASIVISK